MDSRIVETKLGLISEKSVISSQPIGGAEVRLAQYLAPAEYIEETAWLPLAESNQWEAGKTVFLRFRLTVPEVDRHIRPVLFVDCEGLEGLLSLDGTPHAGIDANHSAIALEPSAEYSAEVEAATWLRVLHDPSYARKRATLHGLSVNLIDTRVEQAWYDLQFAYEAAVAMTDRRRRALLNEAIEEAMVAIDVTLEGEAFVHELANGKEILQSRISEIGHDARNLQVALTAHAHIDVAWLWTLGESVRKCSRTFSTVASLMDRYPDFSFSCSQPVLYEYTKNHYPALYERISQWVEKGRWETTGGMWVEADCNITSGESLIRQTLHGLRFFREEFGTRPTVCWLPDVFGFPASLPQILSSCGYTSFFTVKLYWQARNRFPHNLFWWRGVDGTAIMTHIPRLSHMYNSTIAPDELIYAEADIDDTTAYDTLLMPFGFGDGGGGPTEKMIEYAERSSEFPGLPNCRHTGAERFFSEIMESDPDLPVWSGELYLETHRGTLTSQARTKRGNRKNELALRNAEILCWMASMLGHAIDMGELDRAWKDLLTLQFHDILPGSSIEAVHNETETQHNGIMAAGNAVIQRACRAIGSEVDEGKTIIVNTLSWARKDPVVVRINSHADMATLKTSDGTHVSAQRIGEDGDYIVALPEIPPFGHLTVETGTEEPIPVGPCTIKDHRMENDLCIVEVNGTGEITRFYDKVADRELIDPDEPANRLQFFQDGPEGEAAWNVHATYERREYHDEGQCKITILESGPVRCSFLVEREFRRSRIIQEIRLCSGERRIDFHTRVNWQERQVLLKVAFPVCIHSDQATYEVQFGAVQRPTHRNTSWDEEKFEVAAHRWVDLSETGYGASLLNDCKYGHDIHGHVVRLSLLRGTERPDPHADLGDHEFTYSFYPHPGDWIEADTVKKAAELNTPPIVTPGTRVSDGNPGVDSRTFATVTGPVIVDTIKPAEDGDGWIFRNYEPYGSRGTACIAFAEEIERAVEVNSVEETISEIKTTNNHIDFEIEPYKLKSFHLSF